MYHSKLLLVFGVPNRKLVLRQLTEQERKRTVEATHQMNAQYF